MPTYEYECTKCGAVTELFQSITEPARRRLRKTDPRACDCDAPVRRRIGTGGGLIFRGSGFYQTDYRSESYKKEAQAESTGGDGKAGGETKSKGDSSGPGSSGGKAETGPKKSKPSSKTKAD